MGREKWREKDEEERKGTEGFGFYPLRRRLNWSRFDRVRRTRRTGLDNETNKNRILSICICIRLNLLDSNTNSNIVL